LKDRTLNVAVFASGGGTNFQALLDHQTKQGTWRVSVLIMNRDAGAAHRAEAAGVPVRIIPTKDRECQDVLRETLAALSEFDVNVILLSGYLRKLQSEVVTRYEGRILNIHPALLPDFGGKGMYGMNVHRAVVESDVEVSGATVHLVSDEYDDGAILGQWEVLVFPSDTPEQLADRVLQVEHRLYPAAVDHLCEALIAKRTPERMKNMRLQEPPDQERSTEPTEELQ
jgi:formyltetrahydrofolate-dependent phosphoribosylglycinamide formyltransferase